ncbi:F-box protein [Pyrus ussuriensis x Pyrus communis]|uniref:F-box protein n=1 Tax=Pyrus ussuriensis x Pyrus communis TaxID=2448454 RepID=A0A5N5FN66_9ROSA|nr:F-box protein [Pyrus ussuriensis x Pyrus communis]
MYLRISNHKIKLSFQYAEPNNPVTPHFWESTKPQGAWPLTPVTWATWVTRMEPHFGDEWKTLGIFDAIKLSTFEINMDRELLTAALSFWCSATNTMVLPFGPIGPTMLDITAILGTSHFGLLIDTNLSRYQFDLDLKAVFDDCAIKVLTKKDQKLPKEDVDKLHKNFFNYSTLINHFAALASDHVLALSPAILANLNWCLAEASVGKINLHQNGPLWVFQLWLQVYFSTLRPEIPSFNLSKAMGLQLASRPIPTYSAECMFKYFFDLEDLLDDEFLICRRQKYPSCIKLPTSV